MSDDNESLVVLPRKKGTGTPYGSTHVSDVTVCAKRTLLSVLHREQAELEPPDDDDRRLVPTIVGSAFHALAQAYHDPAACAGDVINQGAGQSIEELEAKRLFEGYAANVAPNEWGTTDCSERYLPKLSAEYELARAAGLVDTTSQPDLITYCTEADIERLVAKWNAKSHSSLYLPGPGYYMVDYKTAKARAGNHFDKQRHGHQYPLYMYLWNICFPDKPLMGTIVAHVFKLKVPDIQATYVPAPDEITVQRVRQLLELAELRRQDPGRANFSACYGDFGACKWLRLRLCNRLNATEEEVAEYKLKRPIWAPEET